jgi:UDP-N-acetylmuramate--alanine ligase
MKRAELLGILSKGEKSIAVAGTHGKTTISAMIAHQLKVAGIPCNAFLGGISKNYGTNALLDERGEWMVLEADEYDRSFLQLHPSLAIVTSCDPDHLDIYGTTEKLEEAFCEFISQIAPGGSLVCHAGLKLPCLDKQVPSRYDYGLEKTGTAPAMCSAHNIRRSEGRYRFDIDIQGDIIKDVELGVPGIINVENALACTAIARILGIADDDIRKAMASYRGVKRRFDVQISSGSLVYIDDYAHHPREIEACIRSVRENYPGPTCSAGPGILPAGLQRAFRNWMNLSCWTYILPGKSRLKVSARSSFSTALRSGRKH